MKEYYTIQEFSQLSGVEASTLRYWDDIGLFSPITRNPDNNYRYYALTQILALNFVTVLSDLDFPLKTIAELREDRDPERFMRLLDKQEMQMDMEMQRLRLRYSIIHARRELINFGMRIDENEIGIMKRDYLPLTIWPPNEYHGDDTFIEPLAAFINQASDYHVNLSFPVGGYYQDLEQLAETPKRPQSFFSIDPMGKQAREEREYLVGFARGDYGEMGDTPERMLAYAQENRVDVSGPTYAIYLYEESSMKEPSEYLVELCATVVKPSIRSRRREE